MVAESQWKAAKIRERAATPQFVMVMVMPRFWSPSALATKTSIGPLKTESIDPLSSLYLKKSDASHAPDPLSAIWFVSMTVARSVDGRRSEVVVVGGDAAARSFEIHDRVDFTGVVSVNGAGTARRHCSAPVGACFWLDLPPLAKFARRLRASTTTFQDDFV